VFRRAFVDIEHSLARFFVNTPVNASGVGLSARRETHPRRDFDRIDRSFVHFERAFLFRKRGNIIFPMKRLSRSNPDAIFGLSTVPRETFVRAEGDFNASRRFF